MKKLKKTAKSVLHKTVSFILSFIMIFSCVNFTGLQNVFAASMPSMKVTNVVLGRNGQSLTCWGNSHFYSIYLGQQSAQYHAFCLDPGKSMGTGYKVRQVSGSSLTSAQKKVLNWYYSENNDRAFVIAQVLLWGLMTGDVSSKFTETDMLGIAYETVNGEQKPVGTLYKDHPVINEIRKLVESSGYSIPTTSTPMPSDKEATPGNYAIYKFLTEVNQTGSSGTFYYWTTGNSANQRLVGKSANPPGTVEITPEFGEVSREATYSHSDRVTVNVNKKDADTNQNLEGITFDLYRDNSKIATLTTDVNGNASYTWSTTYTQTRSATKKYCTNWNEIKDMTDLLQQYGIDSSYGQYTSKNDASNAAYNEAYSAAVSAVNALLNENHTFKLVETATREEYYLDPNNKSWSQSNHSGSDGVSTVTFNQTNKPQYGSVKIKKTDSQTGNSLDSAKYALYAAEDIVHPDGKSGTLFRKDEKVADFNFTDNNGEAVVTKYTTKYTNIGGLLPGKYYIKEVNAPYKANTNKSDFVADYGYGYIKVSDWSYTFELKAQDSSHQYTNPSQASTTQSDAPQRVTVEMEKKDTGMYNYTDDQGRENNSSIVDQNGDGAQGDATRVGAVYGLYAASTIKHPDEASGTVNYSNAPGGTITLLKGTDLSVKNVSADAGTLLATAKTDENGQIQFGNLFNGKYYIQEIEPPEGYLLDTNKYYYDGSYTNDTTPVIAAVPVGTSSSNTSTDDKDGSNGYVFDTVKKQAIEIKKNKTDSNGSGTTEGENGAVFKIILESDYQALIDKGYTPTEAKTELLANGYYDEITTHTETMIVNGVERTFDGYAKSVELPYGTYRLIQTVSPGEYAFADDTIIHIVNDSRNPKSFLDDDDPEGDDLLLIDQTTEEFIKIQKKDSVTGEIITLHNAEFEIITNQDIKWGGKEFKKGDKLVYSYSDGTQVDTWVTDDNTGMIQLPEKLISGSYTAVEINAPELYQKDAPEQTFRVTKSDIDPNADGEPVVTVVMKDTPQVGEITISKQGEVLVGTSTDELGNINFSYEDRLLPGATVQLVAREDIINPATGEVLIEKGTVVETKTTGEDGTLIFTGSTNEILEKYNGLLLGEYYVQEIEAPEGYTLNSEKQNVSLEYAGQDEEKVLQSKTIYDDRTKVQLSVDKADTEDTPVANAKYGVYAKEDILSYDGSILVTAGTLIETRLTNASGRIEFSSDLPLGRYQVKEIEAPNGYILDTTVHEADATYKNQDISVIRINFIVKEYPTYVEIVKVDKDSQEEISGASLELYNSKGSLIDAWVSRRNSPHAIEKLNVGEEYTIKETYASEGYLVTADKTFTVENTKEIQKIVVEDESVKGKITVIKKGEALTDATADENGNYTFVYEDNQPLEGAVFEIHAKENIPHPDGVSEDLYKKGDLVATITTGKDGTATTDELPLGEYTVTEKTAPEGYLENDEVEHVTLSYEDDTTPVVYESAEFTDERQKVEVSAVKKDADTDAPLKGAEFTVYNSDPIVSYSGEILIEAGTKIETIVTDDKGEASVKADLPLARYTVAETKAPDGYNSTSEIKELDATYKGQDQEKITETFEFSNHITQVEISKKDITSEVEIAGNILQVFDSKGELVDEWTSKLNESHIIKGLKVGETYTLVEKFAAEGYLKAENIEFTVVDNGDSGAIQKVQTMYNEHEKGQIHVTKKGQVLTEVTTDSDGNIQFVYELDNLSGAVFEVYADEDIRHPDGVSDDLYKKDELVATITSEEDGIARTDSLPLGKYRIIETTAPEGYLSNSEIKHVELSYENQNIAVVYSYETYLNDRQTVSVNTVKRDSETEKVVQGAEFSIYADEDILSNDGQVLVSKGDKIETVTTEKDGKATFTADLPLSKYIVRETKAPDGYHSTSKEYELDASYQGQDVKEITVNYEFENNPTDIEISKQDSSTGTLTQGNILQVFDKDGFIVDEWTTELNSTHHIKYLTVGETYTLVEKVAAQGYVKAEDITFTVQDLGDAGGVQKITPMQDDQVKGQITIEKRGEALVGVETDSDGNLVFRWDERGLEGAVFNVYAKEHIVNPDGVSPNYYNKGDLVTTLTTGKDGTATTEKLPLGEYRVVEVTAPDGYLNNENNTKDVKLVYKDQFTSVVFKNASFENERQKVELEATKKDSKTDEMVQGAEFTLYAKEDISDYNGNTVVRQGQKIETAVTDKNGKASFKADLPLSMYEIRETKAPDGYHSTELSYDFDATYKGPEIPVISASYEFVNIPTKVKISKQDITTQVETAGNYLQVFDSKGELVDEWVSELDKSHYIEYLKVGEEYTLVEKLAANGYLKADDIKFVVEDYGDKGGVQEVQIMYDELVHGKISVEKQGEVLTGIQKDSDGNISFQYEVKGLAGAVYEVYAKEDIRHPDGKSEDFYKAGDLVATLTTGEDGTATTDELPLGAYEVKEITAPDGFVINGETKEADLVYKDQYTELVFDNVSFENERQKVDIDSVKKDSKTDEGVEGAEFTLYADEDIYDYTGKTVLVKAGDKIQTVTTGDDGTAVFTDTLPLSQYTVKETKAPVGYHSTAVTDSVNALYQGQDISVIEHTSTFVNIPTKVKISKQDITTQVETAGNYLQVFDSEGNLVDEWISELDKSHYIEYLHVGEEYTLVEKLAANGYLKADDIKFTVIDDGDQGRVQEVQVMYDELVHGKISIEKQGEVLTGITADKDGNISFIYEEQGLKGAEYEIYAREDISHPDGKSDNFYDKGDLVATITTDESGKATSDELPLGAYEVREKTAPDGFVLNGQPQNADLVYEDQYTELVYDSVSFTNEKQDVEITVKKQDLEKGTYLSGAEFTLYAKEDICDVNGNVLVEAGTAIEKAVTDENGTAKFKADLPLGNYTVKETKAPEGYASNENNEMDIDATYKGQLITVISTEAGFKNKQIEFDISKTSITTGNELPGATLAIYPADENGQPVLGECFETWVSSNVPHKIYGLEVGKEYVLVETSAPFDDGYVTSESINFTVSDTEEVQKVTMVDDVTKVSISKTDLTTGAPVEGAKLSVYKVEDDGTVADEPLYTWITTDEPHYIEQIPVGKYVLREELYDASELGYVTAEDVEFEVLDTKEIQKAEMKDDHTHTEFVKEDTDGERVSGATMAIVPADENGNPNYAEIFDTWMTQSDDPETEDTDESIHTVEYLPIGKYLLVELSAPDGYVKALPVEFTVEDTAEVQQFSMTEKYVSFTKTDVTGDKEVPGAHIVVKDEEGNTVDEWISSDEPHKISGLEEDKTYTLTEETAPDGYVKAETIEFTVTTDKENQFVEMKDKQVSVTKTDIVDGKPVSGAELTVTDKETGEIVDKWITDENPHYVSGLEEDRTYILTEVTAPDGYGVAESIEFTVTNEKVNQKVEMQDAPLTDIQVNKVDSATMKAICSKDFEFTMYSDPECTQVLAKVNANQENGTATFEDVDFGTYYIKETKAPLGYLLSDEVKKVVVDENLEGVGKIHSFVYKNTLEPVKVTGNRTGDDTSVGGYAAIGGLALVCGTVIAVRSRKKEND